MTSNQQLPDGILPLPIIDWENAHETISHHFTEGASFKLIIPHSNQPYQDTTKNFQWLIRYAIDHQLQLRAVGSGWSFSPVAVCNGGLVDTKSLRLTYVLKDSFVAADYLANGGRAADLFFTECGMSILALNDKLEQQSDPKRSLKASGASNGQTIAGCIATGTHGAAYKVGAVHDTVLGLHIVVGPDRHVWLERKTRPVASDDFINWLGAEAIKDDDIFNAALVSFGSFGFVHGVLLETEPIFLLEQFRSGGVPYTDEVKQALNQLDFSSLSTYLEVPPDDPVKQLYHFQLVVNPFRFEVNNPEKGLYLKTMYKIPYYPEHSPDLPADDHGFTYGDDTLGVIEKVLDLLGADISALLVPPLVNKLFPLAFELQGPQIGTIGETFNNTQFRGKAASVALGIDSSNASRVLEEMIALNKMTPYPGGISLRYVKGSEALLAFTTFPVTCVIEMDGVDCKEARNFFDLLWARMEQLDIPYTLHWGKLNYNLNGALVKKMYGEDNVTKWIASRKKLLDDNSLKVFTNDFLQKCGLA